MDNLPKKLAREPLVDAIFEVRFNSVLPAAEILPGILYSQLEGNKVITTLPASEIPRPVRNSDPNFQYAPISRLDWGNFFVNFSDKSISIACKLPYPGWINFKEGIGKVLALVAKSEVFQSVNRYAIKYINLIPSNELYQQISLLNLDLTIANHKLEKEVFHVRMEVPESNYINVIQAVSSAKVKTLDGNLKYGVIIDIDTIRNLSDCSIESFMSELSIKLDEIHLINKSKFFSCLKPDTIQDLGAMY